MMRKQLVVRNVRKGVVLARQRLRKIDSEKLIQYGPNRYRILRHEDPVTLDLGGKSKQSES